MYRSLKVWFSTTSIIAANNIVNRVLPPPPLPENAERGLWAGLLVDPPVAFWRSLRYFSGYRLGVSLVFLLSFQFYGSSFNLGFEAPGYYFVACKLYVLFALVYLAILKRWQRWFSVQLTLQVVTDITVLTLMMYYSGGARSGLTFMMVIVLAGAGLVGQGRLSLLFAALATLAVLVEQSQRVLHFDGEIADFTYTGIVSIGFFAMAITARMLARRVVAHETLAYQRGKALAEQIQINERVIRDMQDGVLVVDAHGWIQQTNPSGRVMLGLDASSPDEQQKVTWPLSRCSTMLAEHFHQWRRDTEKTLETLEISVSGQTLRARLLQGGEGDQTLIYLEDMRRIEEQARQLKLAALGRLTANMAHEIRNPLAAISHATELLADEHREAMRLRLIRIIGDNTHRLNRLVAEVLELGRRDRAQPEWLNLRDFLITFLEEFSLHDGRVKDCVTLNVMPDAMIWFDRCHLNRVIWNLLSNALRYGTCNRESVKLEAHCVVLPDQRTMLEFHMTDDGPGIDEVSQSQIFEPFFSTCSHGHETGAGTGLGLYIARELCEANGARLDLCENAPGAHFCLVGTGALKIQQDSTEERSR